MASGLASTSVAVRNGQGEQRGKRRNGCQPTEASEAPGTTSFSAMRRRRQQSPLRNTHCHPTMGAAATNRQPRRRAPQPPEGGPYLSPPSKMPTTGSIHTLLRIRSVPLPRAGGIPDPERWLRCHMQRRRSARDDWKTLTKQPYDLTGSIRARARSICGSVLRQLPEAADAAVLAATTSRQQKAVHAVHRGPWAAGRAIHRPSSRCACPRKRTVLP